MTNTAAQIALEMFTVGAEVRIGAGKAIWTVVRVTTPEQATMLRPAGIGVARDTGHGRAIGIDRLNTVAIV